MTKPLIIFRLKLCLHILRVVALLFVSGMIYVQIPEFFYDLKPRKPISIADPSALSLGNFPGSTFVSIEGEADFENAFVYKRYGLSYTYFNIKPYAMRMVVRTYQPVTDEWDTITRFLGKLRPFTRQPFHYKIRDIYQEKFAIKVPEDAFFLALDDVPQLSGWQIGAFIFACVLWVAMFYMFYFYRWNEKSLRES
ncbi:hypothetical protein ACFL1Z_05295 [Thermodesulfobacteriota bacterium]